MPNPASTRLSRLALLPLLALLLLGQIVTAQDASDPIAFEIEALNPGLPPLPEAVDRSTPQGAMESFLHYAAQDDFGLAAHMLDLSGLELADQENRGAELAAQLYTILDRKTVIPWDHLSDRPDGRLRGGESDPGAGRARRSVIIDWLELGRRSVPIRINRVQPSGSEAAWVIARQSVDNIPALHQRYGPTDLERALPFWMRNTEVLGLYLWEAIFTPILLALAAFLAWITYMTVGKLTKLGDMRLTRSIIRALRWPLTIAVTTTFIGFGTSSVFVVSGILDTFIRPAVLIALVSAATLAMVLIIEEILEWIGDRYEGDLADPENAGLRSMATTISAVRKFVIVIAVITALGLILDSANTFETFGYSLLASAGALTILIGFAAREVLGNILASVQIALNRSARIGDLIIFEGMYCYVERIHFTYVQLRIWTGNRFVVPVSHFVKDAFQNWSIEEHHMLRLIEVTLAQTADVDALRRYFIETIETEDGEETGPASEATALVRDQDVFGQKVLFALPTPNPSTGWEMECRMRERLLNKAREIQQETGRTMLPSADIHDLPDG
jgi:small-conductance mechanosensitive channel